MTSRFNQVWIAAALACLIVFALTRINYRTLPLDWPDEALFSSPAAELAERGVFATPVLYGLIPGMREATLWNAPLYMVLTAGVYVFTGESRLAARSVSLAAAFAALFVFASIVRRFREPTLYVLPLILAWDPTFLRAANTARMDMLTLLFMLLAMRAWLPARLSTSDTSSESGARPDSPSRPALRDDLRRGLTGGLAMGLAAVSHPIAVLLVPVALILLWPRWRAILAAGAATCVPLTGWLIYILQHPEVFEVQFVSQLVRKQSIFSLWGGETGGVFKVFAAQYLYSGWGLALPLLAAAFVLGAGGLALVAGWQRSRNASPNRNASERRDPNNQLVPGLRLGLSAAVIFGLVLLYSEAWYPLFVGPPLVLFAGWFWMHARKRWPRWLSAAPLAAIALVFAGGSLGFAWRAHARNLPEAVAQRDRIAVEATRGCGSVYLRVRPDPYFALRKARPELAVLEFVPGKLRFRELPGGVTQREYLHLRYDRIDCFLLDQHASWEPILSEYLKERRAQFKVEYLGSPAGLDPAWLWRRK